MKKVAFTLVTVIVALALSISAAMLIGRAQPLPERVALLHLNDICKLPCWIGITPGVTTYDQALAIVRRVYGDQIESAGNCYSDFCIIDRKTQHNKFQVSFLVNPDNNTIGEIQINLYHQLPDDHIHMGDIYDSIGAPGYSVYVSYVNRGGAYYTNYGTEVVVYSPSLPVLAPQWPISGMVIR